MASKKTEREYVVVSVVQISMSTTVRATSAREARKLARERPVQTLCHQCSRGDPTSEWVTGGEFDCEPPGENKLRTIRRKK